MHHEIQSAKADDYSRQNPSTLNGDHFLGTPEDQRKSQTAFEAHRQAIAQKVVDRYFGNPEMIYNSDASRGDSVDKLVKTAEDLIGADLTISPAGSRCGQAEKKYGCAATMSNLLLKEHLISAREFCTSVDDLEKLLIKKGASRVSQDQLRKGDFVVGRGERDGSGGRHVGLVDMGDAGQLVALNNRSGCFSRDALQQRFIEQYHHVYGWRLKAATQGPS